MTTKEITFRLKNAHAIALADLDQAETTLSENHRNVLRNLLVSMEWYWEGDTFESFRVGTVGDSEVLAPNASPELTEGIRFLGQSLAFLVAFETLQATRIAESTYFELRQHAGFFVRKAEALLGITEIASPEGE